MKKKNIAIVAAALILVALIGTRLVANKHKIDEKKKVTTEKDVQIPVNVAAATMAEVNENLVKTGTLVPYREANIAATTSGTIQHVSFALGSNVTSGDVLAEIDNNMLQLKMDAAVLQQQKLQRDYARYTRLLEGEATTETNLQEIKYNLDNAGNQVSQIKKQIQDNRIKSPISGQIVSKKIENGEYVSPGTSLGKIVDVSRLKVDVQVSENDAYKIKAGQPVNITTDVYDGQTFSGKVVFVSQQGDAAHNYQVQVELPNSHAHPLKAGTFVYADFVQNSAHSALQIPRSALVESMKNPYVYVVQDGKAATRKIVVGTTTGANVEVLDGLKEGEKVVVNGQINIMNGSSVRVAN